MLLFLKVSYVQSLAPAYPLFLHMCFFKCCSTKLWILIKSGISAFPFLQLLINSHCGLKICMKSLNIQFLLWKWISKICGHTIALIFFFWKRNNICNHFAMLFQKIIPNLPFSYQVHHYSGLFETPVLILHGNYPLFSDSQTSVCTIIWHPNSWTLLPTLFVMQRQQLDV